MHTFPLLRRAIDWRRCAPHIHKSQPPSVAMRQNLHTRPDQLCTVTPYLRAMVNVLIRELLRRCHRQLLPLLHTLSSTGGLQHSPHRVHRIHRCWPRILDRFEHHLRMLTKPRQIRPLKCPQTLRQSIRRRRANRSCPAHDHVPNRRRRLPKVLRRQDLKPVRQQSLLDEQYLVPLSIKRDRSIMSGATTCRNIHALKSGSIFPCLRSLPSAIYHSGSVSDLLAVPFLIFEFFAVNFSSEASFFPFEISNFEILNNCFFFIFDRFFLSFFNFYLFFLLFVIFLLLVFLF